MGACGYRVGGMPLPLILKTKRLSSRCSKLLQNCVNAQHSLTLYYLFRERLVLAEKVLWLLVLLAITYRFPPYHFSCLLLSCRFPSHYAVLCKVLNLQKQVVYKSLGPLCKGKEVGWTLLNPFLFRRALHS